MQGFDSKGFRKSCGKKEINANICFNRRNGDTDRNEYFDKERYGKDTLCNAPMHVWGSYHQLLNRFDTTNDSWQKVQLYRLQCDSVKEIQKKAKKKFE